MGSGLAIFIHLFVIFILSVVTAVIATTITAIFSSREKRLRKILLSTISPFLFFFGTYMLALIGSLVVSDARKVDIGIGDYWYVPLNDSCRLAFSDLPEQSSIECGENIGDIRGIIILGLSRMQQNGEIIYGERQNGEFFILNLANQDLKSYPDVGALKTILHLEDLNLVKPTDFYSGRKEEVLGNALVFVGLGASLIGIVSIIIFCRVVLYGFQRTRQY